MFIDQAIQFLSPLGEVVLRVGAVYLSIIIMFRMLGYRALGQLSPFDFVTVLLLSSAVQNSMVGKNDTLMGGVMGALTLLIMNNLVTHSKWLRHILIKQRVVLVRDGELINDAMKGEGITIEHLWASLRESGISDIMDVKEATLEPSGRISVINTGSDKTNTDPLTGLQQYWMIGKAMETMRSDVESMSALLIDINSMAKINSSYGYEAGNSVLRMVCMQLLALVRQEDKLFRYSGDCFMILAPVSPDKAARLAERIIERVNQNSVSIGGIDIAVNVTVGVIGIDSEVQVEVVEKNLKAAVRNAKISGEKVHTVENKNMMLTTQKIDLTKVKAAA